ncbi:hypothetical protein Desgi_1320 [Desulfoscipio gibsoniae DSM 7213]|uniref:Uncharacterized protein n=2 Tax=Desulfoscipio gibsoniae TaxID=102134 RepID=R4KGN7_9FIRM|nr:hypothetical protein Desgi_1320 [Desulfoscipio gibsoniae DSM 7213]
MLFSLGICIGLIFFSINIALINFNRLVVPEQPLVLLNWHADGEKLEICLLGETLRLPNFGGTWPGLMQNMHEQVGILYSIGRDEFMRRLDPVQQKVRESIGWP